jgi:hypothetical protein
LVELGFALAAQFLVGAVWTNYEEVINPIKGEPDETSGANWIVANEFLRICV